MSRRLDPDDPFGIPPGAIVCLAMAMVILLALRMGYLS